MEGKDLIINDPIACSPAKDFFRQQTSQTIWNNLVQVGDPVNAYGWIHAEYGKSERLTKCLIQVYERYSHLFSIEVSNFFKLVKKFDQTNPENIIPKFSLDKTFPLIDRSFTKGLNLIFSPALGDREGLMDTANCIAFVGLAVGENNIESVEKQTKAINEAKSIAMNILIKEYPHGK